MLLPSRMLYGDLTRQMPKTQVERNHDVGMLWEVLAADPQADETTRVIARMLLGAEEPY